MNLTKGIKEMTIDDLNDNLDPNEPTDEELAEIESNLNKMNVEDLSD